MKAYRADVLTFQGQGVEASAHLQRDGYLVVGQSRGSPHPIFLAVGDAAAVKQQLTDGLGPAGDVDLASIPCEHLPGKILAPGFVDLHVHYPQVDVIGSPATGLLPWLENYTFPQEMRFADPAHCAAVADVFIQELMRHGVTTALAFATSHPASVNALFERAQQAHMRLITGKCLMDQHAPEGLRDTTEQSLLDSETLIQRWHGVDRLGYALTPRFVPTCSEAQLRGAGELAARYPSTWIQSHVAENRDEVAWVAQLFPKARSYLSVYEQFGLLRERALYAHGIYLDNADRQLLAQTQAAVAVSPTSNLFLGSGFFDHAAAERIPFHYGLASDVGGGTSFSPFQTMLANFYAGQASALTTGQRAKSALTPQHLWWRHTAGAAEALGLGGVVGNLAPGHEADFLVLNPQATPLLARRVSQAKNLDELLFAMIVLGDDRLIERTVMAGETRGLI